MSYFALIIEKQRKRYFSVWTLQKKKTEIDEVKQSV